MAALICCVLYLVEVRNFAVESKEKLYSLTRLYVILIIISIWRRNNAARVNAKIRMCSMLACVMSCPKGINAGSSFLLREIEKSRISIQQ